MTLTLYENKSDERIVDKTLIQTATYEGYLRDESSITNPVVLIEGIFNIYNNGNTNYMYLPDYRRYYYITDIIQKRANLVEIHGRVDVLMSFKNEIRGCTGIVKKQANKWNMYLDDGSLKVYQNKVIITKEFPSGFNDERFVLITSGS